MNGAAHVTGFPAPFADLARFAAFALPTEAQRMAMRLATPMPELLDFYHTVLARMDALVAHLGQWEVEQIPKAQLPLLWLGLMFMEAAAAVELFHDPDVPQSLPADRLTVYEEGFERTWGQT